MAFERMTAEDAAWMAKKMQQFNREQLQAIVKQADMSDPAEADKLLEALLRRREVILERYLPLLN